MAKWIQPARVRGAIAGLAYWRDQAKSQPAMHLWPLLALIEAGVNTTEFASFTEAHDFDFWDKFFRYPNEQRERTSQDGFAQHYYVDPLVQLDKPGDYPHRSPSTIRVRTFQNSWKAAQQSTDGDKWKLAPSFATIFDGKVLQKGGVSYRVPVVELAIWLYRDQEFPDTATAKTLEDRFKHDFPFRPSDYDMLFQFNTEPPEHIFTESKPSPEELRHAIEQSLIKEKAAIPPELFAANDKESEEEMPRSSLVASDPVLLVVRKLMAMGTSGVIFRGCPGTSKTWYAKQIAKALTVRDDHIYQVQFHPSYGYEDFVEGYIPDEQTKSGFKVVDKSFVKACEAATGIDSTVVFIIDEINRGDPARIFGDLLTYIEFGYRGQKFPRAYSSKETSVPPNLLILGTMNRQDRSLTQFDLALMRRFDHIDLEPSAEVIDGFLQASDDFTPEQISHVTQWFERIQKLLPLGHTYFKDASTPEDLQTIWQHRIFPYCETYLEFEPEKLENVRRAFDALVKRLAGQGEDRE